MALWWVTACNPVVVTEHDRSIDGGWIDALTDSLDVFGTLIVKPAVVDSWSDPSILRGYTVGGIAGHVLSLIVGLRLRIDAGPNNVQTIPVGDWYGPALSSETMHTELIEIGEQLAATGPAKLAVELAAASADLARCLLDAQPDFTVPLASINGAGVRLDDFLKTRFVEITVHARDIASSTGLPTPALPAAGWDLAASVIAETTGAEGSGADFVLTVVRPNRADPTGGTGP